MLNKPDHIDLIREAKDEWSAACSRFELATDHKKIELAIYQMISAKHKYMFVLKQCQADID